MPIVRKAAAKLNLLLDLSGVIFPDGYHEIGTVMQSVGIYDTVTLSPDDSVSVSCTLDGPLSARPGSAADIPCDKTNTAYKAALRFAEYTGKNVGVRIGIVKRIPSGAGLAGGSADAAAVISGLDEMYHTGLSQRQLCEIGARVGADVPFCLVGGTMLAQNVGDLLTPLPPLSGYRVLIVKPDAHVSTKEAYAAFDSCEHIRHPSIPWALNAYLRGDLKTFFAQCANVFEQTVEVAGRAEIKAAMRSFGSELALMTGSGSAIFGLFRSEDDLNACAARLPDYPVFSGELWQSGLLEG
ncbi:MAG: 4-(cytidine 5'-diphospho)-2-C-methyl-D-erythritol kinase [Clostridia bacterium]|nr:4-(cytidine 5'-diphospho)-2-C-methyl-D-erythritol kinase [Clostridia bacterium]MBR5427994.1 4-(cytidine 5'-diphospho)-2-C-methyl-D-erythritol kinase [Clostridia bacterium]